METVPFVDTYIHFIDHSNPGLNYHWLQPESRDPRIGEDLERLKHKNCLVDDYLRETEDCNVIAAIHVDAGASRSWSRLKTSSVRYPVWFW